MVVWLEDIKIRLYSIDDRTALRDSENKDWPNVFKRVSHAEPAKAYYQYLASFEDIGKIPLFLGGQLFWQPVDLSVIYLVGHLISQPVKTMHA